MEEEDFKNQLQSLIASGQEDSIELAIEIAKGLGMDENEVLESWWELLDFFMPEGDSLAEMLSNLLEMTSLDLTERVRRSLQKSGLRALPKNIGLLYRLEKINLGSFAIQELPKSAMQLKNLEAVFCEIQDKEHLYSLTGLKKMSCGVVNERIGNLVNLENLHLANQMQIPKEISALKKLTILSCYSFGRTILLPENIGELPNLKILSLSGCAFRELPESFCQLTNLVELDISKSYLQFLPEDFGNLSKLEKLHLAETEIHHFPESIAALNKLKSFTLKSSKMDYLQPEIKNWKLLEHLSIDDNIIDDLPDWICNLTNLKELSIKINPIKKLPKNFGALQNLEYFSAHGCPIKDLPESFINLKKLKNVHLSNGQVSKIGYFIQKMPWCNFTTSYKKIW